MLDGVTVRMGGKDWVIPPMNLKLIKRYSERLQRIGPLSATAPEETLDTVVEVIHAAMGRNYPDLTVDQVEDVLDLGNMNNVIAAVMGVSGFLPADPREGVSPSIGDSSTPTLPPDSAGLMQ